MLTVLFNDSLAVVLRIDEEAGGMMIADGDGLVRASESLEFHGPVGVESFTGEVILADSVARRILLAFAEGHEWPPGTRWQVQ